MKKIYATVCLALGLSQGITAQGWITITDEYGTDVTNGTTSLWMWTGNTMVVHLTSEIGGVGSRNVNVKRYEVAVLPGSQNYFCWNLCYLPQEAGDLPLWVAADQQMMYANQAFSGFGAYHMPDNTEGYSTYRYVWYDANFAADSAFVDITFGNSLGVNDVVAAPALSMQPNPANQSVLLNFGTASGNNDRVVVCDALGAQVLSEPVLAGQRNTTLSTAALRSGVYFVSILRSGAAVSTQRLAVTH